MALLAGLPLNDIGVSVLVGLGVLALGFTFFSFGWIGGGDAVRGGRHDVGRPGRHAALSGLRGLLVRADPCAARRAALAAAGLPGPVEWIDRLHDSKTGVPYGIALAAAGILVYPHTAIFQRLVG